jgi:hypothetical protein
VTPVSHVSRLSIGSSPAASFEGETQAGYVTSCTCACVHTYMHTYIHTVLVRASRQGYSIPYVFSCVCACVCVRVLTYKYTCIHTYTNTHSSDIAAPNTKARVRARWVHATWWASQQPKSRRIAADNYTDQTVNELNSLTHSGEAIYIHIHKHIHIHSGTHTFR